MDSEQQDYITQLAISRNPEIAEILKRIPDEKLNTSTTGRSNRPFLISAERNPSNNSPTEFNVEQGQIVQPQIQLSIHNVENTREIHSPSFRNDAPVIDNIPFNLNLLSDTKKCEEIISNCTEILLHFLMISLVFFMFLEIEFETYVLFILLFVLEIISLFIFAYKTKKTKLSLFGSSSSSFFLEFLNLIFITCLIYFFVQNECLKSSFCLITYPPIHIALWYRKNFKIKKPYFLLILGIRILLFVQLIQICLKIDHFLSWEWKNVFWITWIILVTIGFYLMGLFILLLLTSYYTYKGDADPFQLKGLFWCFSNMSNFTIGIFLILISLIKFMNSQEKGFLKICLLINFSWTMTNLIYTKFNYHEIIKFINILVTEKNDGENETYPHQNFEEKLKKQKPNFIIQINEIPDNMPHFLFKFSSTYFQNSNITKEILNKIKGRKFKFRKPKTNDFSSKPLKNQANSIANAGKINDQENCSEKIAQNQNFKKESFNLEKDLPEINPNLESLSKSLQTTDYRNKNDFVEIKDYTHNPQEQTLNSARSNAQETSYNATKVSPRSISLNQSILNCLVCYDKLPDAVFMECGHGGVCYECSVDIWKKNGECYLCREPISKIFQIDIKGGVGSYKPILKVSTMVKYFEEENKNQSESYIDNLRANNQRTPNQRFRLNLAPLSENHGV